MIEADSRHADPEAAAQELLELLESVESWRQPADWTGWGPFDDWPREEVAERGLPPGHWAVYGRGLQTTWYSPGRILSIRVQHRERPPASSAQPPPKILYELEQAWRATLFVGPQERPVLLRNEWEERRVSVAQCRMEMDLLLEPAIRAVRRAAGSEEALRAIREDEFLLDGTVDEAIAELRLAVGRTMSLAGEIEGEQRHGLRARITGKEAADLIGIEPPTLSRWHAKTPAWAKGDELLFKHLIERDGGLYERDRMVKLADWFAASRKHGGQKQIPCP